MHSSISTPVVLVVLVPLIAWRIYSRFKRMIGQQRLTKYRIWIHLALFPALIIVVGLSVISRPILLIWLAMGIAAGLGLGRYGIKTTKFQPELGNLFYTPNAHLGIALSLMFVVRIAYRFFEVYMQAANPSMIEFTRSPLTLLPFGLVTGYYISYTIGLAHWRAKILAAKRRRLEREKNNAANSELKEP